MDKRLNLLNQGIKMLSQPIKLSKIECIRDKMNHFMQQCTMILVKY